MLVVLLAAVCAWPVAGFAQDSSAASRFHRYESAKMFKPKVLPPGLRSSERVQVVCGAPNARTGMKGVFAPAGSHIPGTGLDLKAGVIRGEASNGMLCSMREMGLGQDHDGIIDLPADTPIGKPFAEVMGLNDPIFDVKVTPDRADCLSVAGIARDLAAAGLGRLIPRDLSAIAGSFELDSTEETSAISLTTV